MKPTVLSMHYLPCISWFHHFSPQADVVLDRHEHFVKQTYRNRCVILSANGPLSLTVPVRKKQHHMPMHEVEIENDFNWQKQHWEAIRSAYGSSPFFEHYGHHFASFYQQPQSLLCQFNLDLIETCSRIMKLSIAPQLSEAYIAPADCIDLREQINPKKDSGMAFKPYLQVFSEKFPFIPDLSIIDLIFNQGPASRQFL